MSPEAWISIVVTIVVFALLQLRRRTSVEIVFLSAMLVLVLAGVISPDQALGGFSDNAPVTIAGLLIVAAGLRDTGVIDWVGRQLLGRAETDSSAVRRLAVALVPTSAFLLNTALVVMAMPFVADWCRRRNVSPSKLMIPISYLTMLGGVCTLVGTSTTLIVNSKLREAALTFPGVEPMGLFDITWVGIPTAIVGTFFLLAFGSKLLPNRTDLLERFDEERREYLVEMYVQPDCSLIGQTVERAGLRHLPGLFLVEISRGDTTITPVAPTDLIHADDRLVFTGVVNTIVDLEKIPGLVPIEEVLAPQSQRRMAEAVLSRSSPLIGLAVRDTNFRQRYNAAIVAVHRNGERLPTKVGDIVLEPGDTLLLQTRDNFVQRYRNNPAFYLVSGVEGYSPRRANKAWIAGSLGLVLVVWLILGNVHFIHTHYPAVGSTAFAALTVAMAMILTRCVSVPDARSAINLQVLLTIVGALALGTALDSSGAAKAIADLVVSQVHSPFWLLVAVYVLGMVMTEMVTNNAVAAILIPIAVSIARKGGHNPEPFIMAVALSASLAFLTPIGYQTNLMVMGPGGYISRDYLKIGFPLAIVVAITGLTSIWIAWPL